MLCRMGMEAVHVAALLRPRIEFAVRESPCAAFAKGIVALAVHHVFARNAGNVLTAFVNILAALEHDGAPAVLNQAQGCKQSARACADHNGRAAVRHVGIDDGREIQFGRLFAHIDIERQVDEDGALPCVNAAAAYAHLGHIGCAQVQLLGHKALEGLRISLSVILRLAVFVLPVKAFVKGHTSSFEEYSSAHRLYIARKDRR